MTDEEKRETEEHERELERIARELEGHEAFKRKVSVATRMNPKPANRLAGESEKPEKPKGVKATRGKKVTALKPPKLTKADTEKGTVKVNFMIYPEQHTRLKRMALDNGGVRVSDVVRMILEDGLKKHGYGDKGETE